MFRKQWDIATDPVYNFCFLCICLIWLVSNLPLLTVFLSSPYTSLENIIDKTFIYHIYPSNTIWRSIHWPCNICTPHKTNKTFLLHEYCLFKAPEINYSRIKAFLSAVNPTFTTVLLVWSSLQVGQRKSHRWSPCENQEDRIHYFTYKASENREFDPENRMKL